MRHPHPVRALLARLALLLAFTLGAAALIVAAPPASDWMGAYADKVRLLEQTPGPRMVLVGGSGLAFGVDSAALAQSLRMPVVNTGLHAGLGLRFILGHVSPFVRAGDLVIVIPEYGMLRDHDSEDPQIWAEALLSDVPESLHGATASDAPELLAGFPPYAQQKMVADPLQLWLASRSQFRDYRCTRSAFDAHGDETRHLAAPQPAHDFHEHIETDVAGRVRMLREVVGRWEASGARVVVSFQAIDADVFDANRDAIEAIAQALRRALGDRVMGTPGEARLPDDAVFDTPHHPNAKGRAMHTAHLTKELSAWLAR
jgi:hypothetical protein